MDGGRKLNGEAERWLRVVGALVLRESMSRFGRSWGGYGWALAEPVGGIVVLTLAVSLVASAPPLGTSFPFFYATGLVAYLAFHGIAGAGPTALQANRLLFAYPAVSPLDVVLARTLLEAMTHATVAALILPALCAGLSLHLPFEPLPALRGFALAVALGLGTGAANAVISAYWPPWRAVWNVATRPLFLASGVLFTPGTLPPDVVDILWYNPVLHVVTDFRGAFYGPDEADWASPAYVMTLAATLFLGGACVMVRRPARLITG
jgi:capsular polysaccharide transport system permease protein